MNANNFHWNIFCSFNGVWCIAKPYKFLMALKEKKRSETPLVNNVRRSQAGFKLNFSLGDWYVNTLKNRRWITTHHVIWHKKRKHFVAMWCTKFPYQDYKSSWKLAFQAYAKCHVIYMVSLYQKADGLENVSVTITTIPTVGSTSINIRKSQHRSSKRRLYPSSITTNLGRPDLGIFVENTSLCIEVRSDLFNGRWKRI